MRVSPYLWELIRGCVALWELIKGCVALFGWDKGCVGCERLAWGRVGGLRWVCRRFWFLPPLLPL